MTTPDLSAYLKHRYWPKYFHLFVLMFTSTFRTANVRFQFLFQFFVCVWTVIVKLYCNNFIFFRDDFKPFSFAIMQTTNGRSGAKERVWKDIGTK